MSTKVKIIMHYLVAQCRLVYAIRRRNEMVQIGVFIVALQRIRYYPLIAAAIRRSRAQVIYRFSRRIAFD